MIIPRIVAPALSLGQQETVAFLRALAVPAAWFIGIDTYPGGRVEVLALGQDFVWSFHIEADGSYESSECALDPAGFSTGIQV